MAEQSREGRRCSTIKANGQQCSAHATNDTEVCVRHLKYPGPGKRKPVVSTGLIATMSDDRIPELEGEDWEAYVHAFLSMVSEVERADAIAAGWRVLEAWQIDSGLVPAPEGWVFGNP